MSQNFNSQVCEEAERQGRPGGNHVVMGSHVSCLDHTEPLGSGDNQKQQSTRKELTLVKGSLTVSF